MRRSLGFSAIFVTHDVVEALLLGDRVGVMRGGRLLQLAPGRELVRAPADDYVADLVRGPLEQARAVESLIAGAPARTIVDDLVLLEDDRRAIPPYDALVLVSDRLARTRPEVLEALRGLSGTIDAQKMRQMNAAVDEKKGSPAAVAARFLDGLRR